MEAIATLRDLLNRLPERLERVPAPENKPGIGKWSAKEELGHLLDSAVNNLLRIVLIQLEDKPVLCSYDGEGWVEVQQYQTRSWS